MQENLSRFDTLKIATQYWYGDPVTTSLIIGLFLLALIIFFVAGFMLQKKLREKNIKRYFVNFAKERELNDREIAVLWEYSHEMDRDPILVLEFKAPFEKVVDLYIKNDPHADERLVKDMRKKLGFEVLSPYVPLVTSKDIEIFQNGRMIFANNKAINVALYDKDERYMYWLAVDGDLPSLVQPGEYVKVVFVRSEDGIYSFELPIAEIMHDGGKTIIKLPHTFDLSRVQRREYPRVKTDIAAKVHYGEDLEFSGTIVDLSAGGARICTKDKSDELKKIRYAETVRIDFRLDDKEYALESKVLEIDKRPKSTCFRLIFESIPNDLKDEIMEYVQKEQLKQAQIKRKR